MDMPETKYARSGDLHIAYQVLGDGPLDIVVVPNWITHVEAMWEIPSIVDSLERLAAFGRAIVYDQRGTGMSDPVAVMATLEERMDDQIAVMDDAGVERAAMIGFSSGGPLAALFSAAYPQRTTALVLANTYATMIGDEDFPPGRPAANVTRMLQGIARNWGRLEPVDGFTERDDRRTMEMWARYQRQAASPGTVAAMMKAVEYNDVRRVLPDIRVPAVVMVHESPGLLSGWRMQHGQYLADNIPDAKLVEITGDEPGDLNVFLDEIEEFLTGARGTADPHRVLATVLFSDIVGSTEIASRIGDRDWRTLLDRHDQMIRRQLGRFRGNEVRTLGDGFLATFDGPARAIGCAQAIRDAAQRLDIEVRVGLHTGEIEMRGDDVGGIAVHIAERVATLAGPSEVLVSRTVTDLVTGSGIRFGPRGDAELKGVPGLWQLFRVEP